jgi:hypothetical protein
LSESKWLGPTATALTFGGYPRLRGLVDNFSSRVYTDHITDSHQEGEPTVADTNATITSMAKQLKEGESVSRSKRIPLDELDPKKVSKKLASMRNSMNQIAARAREATGSVESGQFITYDGAAVVLTCVLTCMEDDGEDDI